MPAPGRMQWGRRSILIDQPQTWRYRLADPAAARIARGGQNTTMTEVHHGLEGHRRLRNRDRGTGQGRLGAAVSRRRHRRDRRSGPVREGLGPVDRRQLRARIASGRAVPDPGSHRRHQGRRTGSSCDARARVGHEAVVRLDRRGGPRRPESGRRHGLVVRRPGSARPQPTDGSSGTRRPRQRPWRNGS